MPTPGQPELLQRLRPPDLPVLGEALEDPVASGESELLTERWVAQKAADRAGELRGIAGRHGETGCPVDDDLRGAVDRGGDNGPACREGLDRRQREPFVERWEHCHVCEREPVDNVRLLADQAYDVGQPGARDLVLQFGSQRALAHEYDTHRRELTPNRGKRLEENAMALLWLQATDDDEYGVVIPEAEALAQTRGLLVVGCEAPDVAAVVDHDNFLRRQALLLDEVAAVGLRDRDVLIDETPSEAIDDEPRLQTMAPALTHVRRLDHQRHAAELADRRREEAPIEEVRVQDVHASRAEQLSERAHRRRRSACADAGAAPRRRSPEQAPSPPRPRARRHGGGGS